MYYLLAFMMCVYLATPSLAQIEYPAINLKIGNTLPDYPEQNPNTNAIKLEKTMQSEYYAFGDISAGDVKLAEATNTLKFPGVQDVTIELKYPSPENTAVISRLEVYISKASKPYSCYVTSFGIRNNSISTWLQSKATNYFEYTVRFYGHKALVYPSTKIQIADKIEDYLEVYPNATVIRMNRVVVNNDMVRYSLGNRFIGADHFVSTASAKYSFPTVQDVALTLEYPQINGNSANVSYVEVLLTEGGYLDTKAYFISGGLSKDYVKLWILTKNTTVFNYDAKIYGTFV